MKLQANNEKGIPLSGSQLITITGDETKMMIEDSITGFFPKRKIRYPFHAIPQNLKHEFIDENRPASSVERLYFIIENLKLKRNISARIVARVCKCTVYQANKDLKFIKQRSNKVQTEIDKASNRDQTVEPEQQPEQAPEIDKASNKIQTEIDKASNRDQTHIREREKKEKEKEKETQTTRNEKIISFLLKPLSKSLDPKDVTIEEATIWNYWLGFYPNTRTVCKEDIAVLKRAIKTGYTISDLKHVIEWSALEVVANSQWHQTKRLFHIKTFCNSKNLDKNLEAAKDWKEGSSSQAPKSSNGGTKRLSDNHFDAEMNRKAFGIQPVDPRYGPRGFKKPEFGGQKRPDGDY